MALFFPGPVDYNGTSVAAGSITADASLGRSLLQGGLIYEVHYAGSPVATPLFAQEVGQPRLILIYLRV